MNRSVYLQGFNKQFEDFVEDVKRVFPENTDIETASTILSTLKKANPKLIIKIWKSYISDKYGTEIIEGDITFFLEKQYNCADMSLTGYCSKLVQ